LIVAGSGLFNFRDLQDFWGAEFGVDNCFHGVYCIKDVG
jgi:hypothetical protein